MIVKVCGMRHPHNIAKVDALGIDLMGFIFYPPSSRYVDSVPDTMPVHARRVGVFVNADEDFIDRHVRNYGLDYLQLHGSESPDFCRTMRRRYPHLGLIKVFSLKSPDDLEQTVSYEGLADYFLFDTPSPQHGGTGQLFDHSLLNHYTCATPFLLSGGLSVQNAPQVLRFSHPRLAGYDLNSRFETAPAMKDTALLGQFLQMVADKQR